MTKSHRRCGELSMKIKEGGVMNIPKEREAFEKWFATRYPNIQKTIDLHNDHESINGRTSGCVGRCQMIDTSLSSR